MVESPPPVPTQRPRLSRSAVAVAIAIVVILAAAIAYVALSTTSPAPRNVPPHVVAVLGNGSLWTDLPLWTWYTPAALPLKGITSGMNLSTFSFHPGPYAHITYRWGNVTGTAEDVRFTLETAVDPWGTGASILPGANGSFEYLPAGVCGEGCLSTGIESSTSGPNSLQAIEFLNLRMTYHVVRMAETENSVDRSWLQVNYTLEPFTTYSGVPLPAANVTLPGPGDLIPVSDPTTYNLTRKQAWSIGVSASEFVQPTGGFRNALPAMSFAPGSVQTFTATLTSEFRWDSTCDSWVWMGADQGTPFTLQWFFDARFGTLLARIS